MFWFKFSFERENFLSLFYNFYHFIIFYLWRFSFFKLNDRFVENKKQCVWINSQSSRYNFTAEVPEGFICGFLLNLIKINGFAEKLSSYVKGFIDDTSELSIFHNRKLQR